MKTNMKHAMAYCLGAMSMTAIGLSSCSSENQVFDEPNARNEISFNVTTDRPTRANVYYGTTEGESPIENFKVSAWVRKGTDASNFGNFANGNSPYFTEEVLTLTDSKWNYENGHVRYWPENGEVLDFYAWVDYDNDRASAGSGFAWTKGSNNRPVIEVKTETEAANMVDLLVTNDDTNFAQGYENKGENYNASLKFSHALAQVGVKAKVVNPKIRMQVAEVALVNINTTGDYYFKTPEDESNWDNLSDETTLTATIDDKEVSYDQTVDLTSTDNTFMVIPGEYAMAVSGTDINTENGTTTVATGKTCFRIKCKIWNVAAGNEADGEFDETKDLLIFGTKANEASDGYAYLYVPATFDWEEGTKYIYTISFGTGNAGFDSNGDVTLVKMTWDVNMTDWTDVKKTDSEGNEVIDEHPITE